MLIMTGRSCQSTLDGAVMSQPHVAPFSAQGLTDHLVELIVSEDDAFYLLDKPAFHQLIHYLCPNLSTKDIPHHTKIHKEVLACAVLAKSKLIKTLQVCYTFFLPPKVLTVLKGVEGEISYTFDTWTSNSTSNNPYISITAHYVSSPVDKPD